VARSAVVPDAQVGASTERSQTVSRESWQDVGIKTSGYSSHAGKAAGGMGQKPGRDSRMLWAACCTYYFGYLRAGEVTTPEKGEFDPGVNLR